MLTSPPEPTKEEIILLRSTTLKKLEDEMLIQSLCPKDIERFKNEDAYIRRFLMHHDNDQKLAMEMVIETFKWRKEVEVYDITEDSFDPDLLHLPALNIYNRDKDGCKMLIFSVRNHVKGTIEMDQVKRLLTYWIERLEREEKGEWITVFFDMRDTAMKNMDLEFIQYMINLFKCYYPWILNYIIVFDMPWLLNAVWRIIKGWLPPKSIEKIKFVDKKTVQIYIAEDQCLTGWGGTDDHVMEFVPERKMIVAPLMNGDIEGRKVHFAEHSPLQQNSEKENSNFYSSGEFLKFQVVPSEELVFKSNRIGTNSLISFTNNSTSRLAYKIKTTSPEKYRVKPSLGTIEPKGQVEVLVTLSDQLAPSLLVRDKFLVIAIPTTQEAITQQEFALLLKNTSSLDLFETKLRVGLVTSESTVDAGGYNVAASPFPPVIMTKIDQLLTRVSVLEEQLASVRRLMYVILLLMMAIVFVFVITTNNLTSSLLAHTTTPVYTYNKESSSEL